MSSTLPESATVRWRDPILNRPECALLGVLTPSCESTVADPICLARPCTWLTRGLEDHIGQLLGSAVLGYEFDIALGTSAGSAAASMLGCGLSVPVVARHHQGIPDPDDPVMDYVYTGTGVPDGHRSLAYRLWFRAPDRTLTSEEAGALHHVTPDTG